MYPDTSRAWFWGSVAAALVLAAGLVAGGFFVGKGMVKFKSEVRTVTVKGLVERDVASDQAQWTLGFRRASDSLPEAMSKLGTDREAVLGFLHDRGFTDAEIEVQPAHSVDRLAQEFNDNRTPRFRYVVTMAVQVKTSQVDRVRVASGTTDELLKAGVSLDSGEQRANPHYLVTKFNDLRPQLLAEATKNARSIANQFAADSGATVGGIQSANQGNIQIFGTDGNDESGSWAPTSTPVKRIRVVSTFEFELR